jgi:hypothetical protein
MGEGLEQRRWGNAVIRRASLWPGFVAGPGLKPYAPTVSRPRIVCLCGSTRFLAEFDEANLRETLEGKIVLSIGSTRRSDIEALDHLSSQDRENALAGLAALHRAKIDLADEVLVINPHGYIGSSTAQEIDYAKQQGKPVRFTTTRD